MTTAAQTPEDLARARRLAAALLDERLAEDAVEAYYALHHAPRRTRLLVRQDVDGRARAFVAVCQTGLDLFRQLAVIRAGNALQVDALLAAALAPGRAYFALAPAGLREEVATAAELSDEQLYRVYTIPRHAFQPVINVLVQRESTPDGEPRWVIRGRAAEPGDGPTVAVAGVNWRSPRWAEVYVQVEPAARGRGLGRSVVSACTSWLFDQGLQPLYLVADDNSESIGLAEALGYRDSRARKLMGTLVRR